MKSLIISTVAVSLLASGASAQNTEVGKRRANQQDRVAQGVKSGQLTAGRDRQPRKEASGL